jgi:tetratricopeptide (TPR) repeat protein
VDPRPLTTEALFWRRSQIAGKRQIAVVWGSFKVVGCLPTNSQPQVILTSHCSEARVASWSPDAGVAICAILLAITRHLIGPLMNYRRGTGRFSITFLALLSFSCSPACPGQARPAPPSPAAASTPEPSSAPAASYAGEAVVVEEADTVFRYDADGNGEKDLLLRAKIQNEAGAQKFSVLSLPYASATETPHIQNVAVHHPDGTSTETPATDAIDMPAPVTQQAPLYSDLKILQIPLRGLRPGDTVEYRVRILRKNLEAQGQFWSNFSFDKDIVALKETLTLDVPAGKHVQVWSPKIEPEIENKGGRRVYVWLWSQLKPTSSTAKVDESSSASQETRPDVAWTTFHTWKEVGEWYGALALPRMVPTDALRAQAEEITRTAKSPLEQVQELYSFVSTHVRYVGIDFGIGRYQPHMPAEVLANQYGDCKDKDTLLEALLRAEGFKTAPALIGAKIDLIADVPSPGFFNHVITTVDMPSGRIWMDSTPGVAPFQLLIPGLRDREALVIPANGNASLERTPAKTPYPFADRFEATAKLNSSGELDAKVHMTLRSDSEVLVRLIAKNLAPAQWDKGTQLLANLLGFSGTTSNSAFGSADDTTQPMQVNYDYTRKPFGDWDSLQIVPLFPVISLPSAPDKQPKLEIDLGALRTETAVSRIELPTGFGADLPDAVHVETPFATFDETFKLDGGEFIAERKVKIFQSKLPASSWEQYSKFAKNISLGQLTWVQLLKPHTSEGTSAQSVQPNRNNAEAARLVTETNTLERSSDWDGALAKLDQAKNLNPEQAYLWSNYGYVAWAQHRYDDAKEDFQHELAHHPDEGYVVNLYADFLLQRNGADEALKVLKSFFERDAYDASVDLTLASVQARTNLAAAISTLQRAEQALPDDSHVQTQLGEYLIRNHQEDEAAALMKKVLASNMDNAELLNDASYVLAESGSDLPLAEADSRKSLQILEGQTVGSQVDEANEDSFRRSILMVASWDTLGFILLQERKLVEARDYLEAAWRNGPSLETGLHYGELEESLGNRKDALRIYELSRGPGNPLLAANPAFGKIQARIAHLSPGRPAATTTASSQQILQDLRTFKLKLPSAGKEYWSGVFRLQLSKSGIQGAMQVSGTDSRHGVLEAIKRLELPHLVPTHSDGRLLRDGVVSCPPGKSECLFVLMPMSTINAERAQ